MRLRRLRGLSQAQLARKLRTKQPAIARLESGKANPQLSTIVDLARALGSSVRIEMQPLESVESSPKYVPWWELRASDTPTTSVKFEVLNVTINNTILVNGPAAQLPREAVETVYAAYEQTGDDTVRLLPAAVVTNSG